MQEAGKSHLKLRSAIKISLKVVLETSKISDDFWRLFPFNVAQLLSVFKVENRFYTCVILNLQLLDKWIVVFFTKKHRGLRIIWRKWVNWIIEPIIVVVIASQSYILHRGVVITCYKKISKNTVWLSERCNWIARNSRSLVLIYQFGFLHWKTWVLRRNFGLFKAWFDHNSNQLNLP